MRIGRVYCYSILPRYYTQSSDSLAGVKFIESYYGKGTTFYVDRGSLAEWLNSVSQANIDPAAEVRVIGKSFRAGERRAREFFWALYNESLRQGRDCAETVRRSLKFEVVFGKPQKRMWLSEKDYADGSRRLTNAFKAKTWCEEIYNKNVELSDEE